MVFLAAIPGAYFAYQEYGESIKQRALDTEQRTLENEQRKIENTLFIIKEIRPMLEFEPVEPWVDNQNRPSVNVKVKNLREYTTNFGIQSTNYFSCDGKLLSATTEEGRFSLGERPDAVATPRNTGSPLDDGQILPNSNELILVNELLIGPALAYGAVEKIPDRIVIEFNIGYGLADTKAILDLFSENTAKSVRYSAEKTDIALSEGVNSQFTVSFRAEYRVEGKKLVAEPIVTCR